MMKLQVKNLNAPRWTTPEHKSIDILVTFTQMNIEIIVDPLDDGKTTLQETPVAELGPMPFHVTPDDSTDHGQALWVALTRGDFGPIAEPVK